MATFWEIAARSVSNLFSLYFVYLKYLFISRFGFKSGICLLIAPVPVHCFSITFLSIRSGQRLFLQMFTIRSGQTGFAVVYNQIRTEQNLENVHYQMREDWFCKCSI